VKTQTLVLFSFRLKARQQKMVFGHFAVAAISEHVATKVMWMTMACLG
jgi:hypothetical protein